MNRILLTGGAGFIGHHMVEHFLKHTDAEIVVLDKLNYASAGLDRLRDIKVFNEDRVTILQADLSLPITDGMRQELGAITHIVHMGAETHVDNSIRNASPFIASNIIGTYELLEYARTLPSLEMFLFFSTDEVFGPAPEGVNYKEGDRHNPSNPYAASKSAAEQLCVSYANTHKLPIVITNTMNVFGERQHPEKYIPMCVKKIIAGETITIHGSPEGKSGSRFYIHARNVADAVLFILASVKEREHMLRIADPSSGRFNIVGEREVTNLELAQLIAEILGKELKYNIVDFHSARPGHDLRYALDGGKLEHYGWRHPKQLKESLARTIKWMLLPENKKWLDLK